MAFVDPTLPGWPSEGFHQVTRNHKDMLPTLTEEDINIYFCYHQVDPVFRDIKILQFVNGFAILFSCYQSCLGKCIADPT